MTTPITLATNDVWAVIPRWFLGSKPAYNFRTYKILDADEGATTEQDLAEVFVNEVLAVQRRCMANPAVLEDVWTRRIHPEPTAPRVMDFILLPQPNWAHGVMPPQCCSMFKLVLNDVSGRLWGRHYVPFIPSNAYPGNGPPTGPYVFRLNQLAAVLPMTLPMPAILTSPQAVPVVWNRSTMTATPFDTALRPTKIWCLRRRSFFSWTNPEPF